MPDLFIIDDNWQEQSWVNTGGTRNKKLLLNLVNNKYYYFKESIYKPAYNGHPPKNYKYEFWSEIIAYEIGNLLGFNVLRYDIGVDNKITGCICESMVNPDKEDLIEGGKYLQRYDISFNSKTKEGKSKYTFQLIENAINSLKFIDVQMFWKSLVEMIVFDTIIGNRDRHQENWAIINPYTLEQSGGQTHKLYDLGNAQFAPVYDSGSSLGRELLDNKIESIVENEQNLISYISKGKYEIRWDEKKIGYFAFLNNLLLLEKYHDWVVNCIKRLVRLFDRNEIWEIIENVDKKLPHHFDEYRIPNERKRLIYKLITLRVERLKELL